MQDVASLDISSIATNLGVFALAVAAAVGGIYKGVKNINKDASSSERPLNRIAHVSITETATFLVLIESNRSLGEALHEAAKEISELRHELAILRATGVLTRHG